MMERKIKDMKIGEVGYTMHWAYDIGYSVERVPVGTLDMPIRRTRHGFERITEEELQRAKLSRLYGGMSPEEIKTADAIALANDLGKEYGNYKDGDSITVRVDSGPTRTATFDATDAVDSLKSMGEIAAKVGRAMREAGPIVASVKVPEKRPKSRHQARLAKHTAMRPLPGDKRAKPERKRRRWFWPAVVTLLTLISGVAGALTIYDRWPESVPKHAVMDNAPSLTRVVCEACESEEFEQCYVYVQEGEGESLWTTRNPSCAGKETP
jgi:hypothetical protein